MDYKTSQIAHKEAWKHREKWDTAFLSKVIGSHWNVAKAQNEFTHMVYDYLKNLLGEDKLLTFDYPIQTYGNYGSFKQVAFIGGILMSNNDNGWCDKPVQPYSGMYRHFSDMATLLCHGQYTLSDNSHKNVKQEDISVVV